MKGQISRRDWQWLSAYVDGELSERERSHFEARLQTDASLGAAVDDLRVMRSMLGNLPRLRAPRNFTLTSEMAGRRQMRAPGLFGTFRFASVASTVLLVMILLGDFLASGRSASMPAQELAAPAAPMVLESGEGSREVEITEQPEISAKAFEEQEEAALEEEPQPMAEALTEDADKKGTDNQYLSASPVPGAGSIPQEGQARPLQAEPEIPQADTAPPEAVRLVELLLGLLAVISGLIAYMLRRQGAL